MMKNLFLTHIAILLCWTAAAQAEYPFGTIMKRVYDDEVIKASANASRAQSFLKSQQTDGSWKDIDYSKTTITDWEPFQHFERLLPMISAYIYDQSALYQNPSLKNGIDKGLQYWADNNFYSDNWWHNEIAVPKAIGLALILLKFGKEKTHQDLEDVLVFKMISGDPYAKTGANKSDIAMHYFYRALITQDRQLLASSLEQLFYPLQLVDGQEGLQYDYSYLQHGPQLYIAGYGEEFMKGISKIMSYVRETPYAIDAERLSLFSNFIRNTYLSLIRSSYIDFNVHGRGISRPNILRKKGEAGILRQMMLVDPTHKAVWEQQIAKLDSTASYNKHTKHNHTHYWKADYSAHLRKGYHFTVRMASNRTNKSEAGNEENIYGKHMTDGVTNIQVYGPEYYNIFPLWEWDKIPGTTTRDVVVDELLVEQWGVPAANAFAGGVSASDYGVSAMQVDYDGVKANKAWFFFDNAVVALGSGITSQSTDPIVTTINQTWKQGPIFYNKTTPMPDSSALEVAKGDYISHRNILYQFPEVANIKLTAKKHSGSWSHINKSRSKAVIEGDVFKLWIDHGIQPNKAKYAYIVYPDTDKLDIKEAKSIQVLQNSEFLQAVRHNTLKITQVVFYKPTKLDTEDFSIETSDPILLQVIAKNEQYEVSVADPNQVLENVKIKLSIKNKQYEKEIALPQNQYKGSTKTIALAM